MKEKVLNFELKSNDDITRYSSVLYKKLSQAMTRIDDINNNKWHYYRKLLNVYDFTSRRIASNRAFYKLWELIKIIPDLNISSVKMTCHLAEAPGSFVEVVDKLNSNAIKIAISKPPLLYSEVLRNGKTIPTFSQNIISKVHNSTFEYMDLLDVNELNKLINKHLNEYDFITADGGIDDNEKYFDKERIHFKLILAEIISILYMLKRGGNCILKIFDCYTDTTMNLIYFLAKHFKKFDIIKPVTSRATNSEKYLICLDYQGTIYDVNNCLNVLDSILENVNSNSNNTFTLCQDIPKEFKNFVLSKLSIYIQNQIDTINYTVNYIKLSNKEKTPKKLLYQKKDMIFEEWQKDFELY